MLLVSFRIRCTSHFQTERNVFSRSTVAASPMLSNPPPSFHSARPLSAASKNKPRRCKTHCWQAEMETAGLRLEISAELRCECGGHSLCHVAVVKFFLTCPPRRSRQAAVSAPLRSDQKERPRLFNQNLFSVVICHPTSVQRWLTARRNRVGLMQRCVLLLASFSFLPPTPQPGDLLTCQRVTRVLGGARSSSPISQRGGSVLCQAVCAYVCVRACQGCNSIKISRRDNTIIIPQYDIYCDKKVLLCLLSND